MKIMKQILKKSAIAILTCLNFFLIPIVLPIAFCSRIKRNKIDIGIGPTPMINNVYFKKLLELKGYSVETFANDVFFITQDFDYFVSLKKHTIMYLFPILFELRLVYRYKCIYIYFNGGPLMKLRSLQWIEPTIYKVAGIKSVVMPYGSDCQFFYSAKNKLTVNALCKDYPVFFRNMQDYTLRNVKRWSKHCDIVIGAMDSIDYMHFWNRIRLCHFAIDTDKITPRNNDYDGRRPVRILHAPNHMAIKGSEYVEKAIKSLIEKGYKIEYVRIQGIPNSELIEKIHNADIVVDQLIMGCYAMFAMESMSAGKPTVCFFRNDLKVFFEETGCVEKDEIPLVNATPTTVESVLQNLLDNPQQWEDISAKSRRYVVKYHSLSAMGDFYDEINKSLGIVPRKEF